MILTILSIFCSIGCHLIKSFHFKITIRKYKDRNMIV